MGKINDDGTDLRNDLYKSTVKHPITRPIGGTKSEHAVEGRPLHIKCEKQRQRRRSND